MEQPISNDNIRQIAILVDSLDRDAADELLEQLDDEHQSLVRDAMVELSSIPSKEREALSRSFLGELERDAVQTETENVEVAEPVISTIVPDRPTGPLADLVAEVPASRLVELLRDEHAQTQTLVVAAMSSDRAAEFIACLPGREQSDVLLRIAELRDAHPLVIETLVEELAKRLTGQAGNERSHCRVEFVQSIVEASDESNQSRLLQELASVDEVLASRLRRDSAPAQLHANPVSDPLVISVEFDRIVDLDTESLERVFNQIDSTTAALALAGASEPCLAEIFQRLSRPLCESLRQAIRGLNALRLSDIHQAQIQIVQLSRRFTGDDTVSAPSGSKLKLMA
ncbi:MAG: FliG C-terminal domain-containing protein [Planctomycetota bacterium]